jgi:hypothetical protein
VYVATNPAAAELFGHSECGSGTAEEVGDEVGLIGAEVDYSLKQSLWLLSVVSKSFSRAGSTSSSVILSK